MPGSATSSTCDESDAVAGADERGLLAGRVPQLCPCPPDHLPAARRRPWVYGGLATRDGHAAGGHALARRLESRHLQLGWEHAEVCESRREAEHVRPVEDRRVSLDHLRRRQAYQLGNCVEVGAILAAIANLDLDHTAGF